jgi:nicotinamidase-related amidase
MISDVAFLPLHLQNDVLHPNGKIALGLASQTEWRPRIADNLRRLLGCARITGIPVVSVRMEFEPDFRDVIQNCRVFRSVVECGAMAADAWGAEFFDDLGPAPREYVVTHSRVNAFFGSRLETLLRLLRSETLVLAGVATNSVVEHTARHAADIGFNVVVASDACGCASRYLHEASLENMSLVAEVLTTAEITAFWEQR